MASRQPLLGALRRWPLRPPLCPWPLGPRREAGGERGRQIGPPLAPGREAGVVSASQSIVAQEVALSSPLISLFENYNTQHDKKCRL